MMELNNWEDRKMVLKRALSGLSALTFALTFASGMLFAQDSGPKVAHTVHSGPVTPAKATPSSLQVIFTNISPVHTAAYNDTTGYYVLGPDNSVGLPEQGIAVPFSPQEAAHVTELTVAVGWISGTKLVNIGLYSDNSGVVGTLLACAENSNIPTFGLCCDLVSVTIPSTSVKGGIQYWIVASSDDTNAPDFTGVFEASNLAIISGNVGLAGWSSFTTNTPAAAARGTIP
jgi:hypothetical protein